MDKKLYKLMDWPKIEEVVYGECSDPHSILGPHVKGSSTLIQCFLPGAEAVFVSLLEKDKKIPMELADEAGFYAILVPGKKVNYRFVVKWKDLDEEVTIEDPYNFSVSLSQIEENAFFNGNLFHAYEIFGAHETVIDGQKGVIYRIYQKNAMRISVVGEFNNNNGLCYPMEKKVNLDLYELFIPGLSIDDKYQYEVKWNNGNVELINDPYANQSVSNYKWTDKSFIDARSDFNKSAFSVYDYSNGIPTKKELEEIKQMGFSHIFLSDIDTISLNDKKKVIDRVHSVGLYVMLSWQPFEYYGDLVEKNILFSTCLYLIEELHADAVYFVNPVTMLYLDYGNRDYIPNIYGGNENLNVIEAFKELNELIHKEFVGVITVAGDTGLMPDITGKNKETGLLFDYQINIGAKEDLGDFIAIDPLFRPGSHNLLSDSMIYYYKSDYLGIISSDDLDNAYGEDDIKKNNQKLLLGYKLLLPGPNVVSLSSELQKDTCIKQFIERLFAIKNVPEISSLDSEEEGFSFINIIDKEKGIISFIRKGENDTDICLVIANFSGAEQSFEIGVPLFGKYQNVLDSNEVTFGGDNNGISLLNSKKKKYDGMDYCVSGTIPGLCLYVFNYENYTQREIEQLVEDAEEKIRREKEAEIAKLKEQLLLEEARIRKEMEETIYALEMEKELELKQARKGKNRKKKVGKD